MLRIRFKAKALNPNDPEVPQSGWVEGFYFEDLDNGELCSFIFNTPCVWKVDRSTLRALRLPDIGEYQDPITKTEDIKELQERLVQTTIDFINERKLKDIWAVGFNVDGLSAETTKYGKWVPTIDSSISVEGLQEEDGCVVRKQIGSYM